jgi:hypothetical protein
MPSNGSLEALERLPPETVPSRESAVAVGCRISGPLLRNNPDKNAATVTYGGELVESGATYDEPRGGRHQRPAGLRRLAAGAPAGNETATPWVDDSSQPTRRTQRSEPDPAAAAAHAAGAMDRKESC